MSDSAVVVGGIVCVALLPALLVITKSRIWIDAGTALLAIAAVVVGLSGDPFALAVAAVLWLGAMLCGLAHMLDVLAERRTASMIYRLLNNDQRLLPVPKDLQDANKADARQAKKAAAAQ